MDVAEDMLKDGAGNITRTTGFALRDGSVSMQELYSKKLNIGIMGVESGAFERNIIVKRLINDLCDSGLKVINYKNSGKNYTAESAIKMLVRTTLNQMTGQISLDNASLMEQDLMELTAHMGARPSHAAWQGQIVSLSGKNDKYLSLQDIGYGDPAGFMGVNCRHNWYPFFEGISEKNYTKEELENIDPPPFEFEGKEYTYYEATQKQRQIERTIRKYKRRCIAYDKAGMEDELLESQIRMRLQINHYKKFNKAGKLRYRRDYLEVYGYNSTITINSGAMKFTLRECDPDYDLYTKDLKLKIKRATNIYNELIDMDKSKVVDSIYKSISKYDQMKDYSKEDIESIYNYVFEEKHELHNGYQRFAPSEDMGHSFKRLIDGRNVQKHDLTMIQHEHMEQKLVKTGKSYTEAHDITELKYNYAKEVEEFKTQK